MLNSKILHSRLIQIKSQSAFLYSFLYIASSVKGLAIKFFEEGRNYITKCKVIALASQKGRTAKTITTLNLGIGLAHQGRKVLLVDADLQGDLTTALRWTDTDKESGACKKHFCL